MTAADQPATSRPASPYGATSPHGPATGAAPSRIDEMLARARARLARVGPVEAAAEFATGALLVDIRPAAQRAAEGEIPGATLIERNVLEWRLDPTSDARLPEATGDDLRVIVVCSEGYTSSLAAAALQELGLHRATDLDGGYQAWAAAGLPTA
jgi:rhodanese-related sulfurtransferase